MTKPSIDERIMTDPGSVSVHDRIWSGMIKSKDELADYVAAEQELKARELAKNFPLRRIIACARRAMHAYSWSRRVAVKFALGHYKAGTLGDSTSYTPKFKPRCEMSGETQNMLTHRRRSMAR